MQEVEGICPPSISTQVVDEGELAPSQAVPTHPIECVDEHGPGSVLNQPGPETTEQVIAMTVIVLATSHNMAHLATVPVLKTCSIE